MSEFDGVIAIDAMGGDFGPSVTVPAAITAMKDYGIKVILVGEEKEIKEELSKYPKEIAQYIKIIPSEGVVNEGESPVNAYRSKPKASIFVSAGLVKERLRSRSSKHGFFWGNFSCSINFIWNY